MGYLSLMIPKRGGRNSGWPISIEAPVLTGQAGKLGDILIPKEAQKPRTRCFFPRYHLCGSLMADVPSAAQEKVLMRTKCEFNINLTQIRLLQYHFFFNIN